MKNIIPAILVHLLVSSVVSHGQESAAKDTPIASIKQRAVCKLELIEIDRSKMRQMGFDWELGLFGMDPEFGKDSCQSQIHAELLNRFKLMIASLEEKGLAEIALSTSMIVSSGAKSAFRADTENREFEFKIHPAIDSNDTNRFHAEVFFQICQPDDLVPNSRRCRFIESSCSGRLNDTTVLDASELFSDGSGKKILMLLMTFERKADAALLSR